MPRRWLLSFVLVLGLLAACGQAPEDETAASIEIDGSSTVAPLTDAVAEEYHSENPDVVVNIGVSGTGGGFERFCNGEIDIANASRRIRQEEVQACEDAGIEYVELQVATDALTVVTNPETDFVECLTFEDLREIWGADVAAQTWQEVDEEFPDVPLRVFAPGADSGTFDFFNEEVLGEDAEPRQDYNASEDDNVIAQGVIGTPGSFGFFGFAFYVENAEELKALEIDAGQGCVPPTVETARAGDYPLARPLFVYVRADALEEPAVTEFARFYLDSVEGVVADVGYIAQSDEELQEAKDTLEQAAEAVA